MFFFFLAIASPCLAWNSTGHELVAQIAYDQLSAVARAKLVTALLYHPRLTQDLLQGITPGEDPDRAIFLRAATWPDMVRYPTNPLQHTENHPIWHYVDYPYEFDGVQGPVVVEQWDGKSDPANLLQAMAKVRAELADAKTTPDRVAIDLCWVEHLVGDIHQPLHAVSLFSKQYPTGDRGGNSQILHNDGTLIANAPTINLHFIWDAMEGLSLDPDVIRKEADRIEHEHPVTETQTDNVAVGDVAEWAKESFAYAKSTAYLDGKLNHATQDEVNMNPDLAPPLPPDYMKNGQALADQRIAQAGYRLAALLEEIAKGMDVTPTTAPTTGPGH
jgi:hypothetical protein